GSEEDLSREMARMRCILSARTPLDEAAISRLVVALKALGREADAWCRARQACPAAMLSYLILIDRVALHVRDRAGWLVGECFFGSEGIRFFVLSKFDEVDRRDGDREVVLTKRFATCDTRADS